VKTVRDFQISYRVGNFVFNQETSILPWTLLCEISCITVVAIHSFIGLFIYSFILLMLFIKTLTKDTSIKLIDMKPLKKSVLDYIFVNRQKLSQEFFK